jgi:hypothetical protein
MAIDDRRQPTTLPVSQPQAQLAALATLLGEARRDSRAGGGRSQRRTAHAVLLLALALLILGIVVRPAGAATTATVARTVPGSGGTLTPGCDCVAT